MPRRPLKVKRKNTSDMCDDDVDCVEECADMLLTRIRDSSHHIVDVLRVHIRSEKLANWPTNRTDIENYEQRSNLCTFKFAKYIVWSTFNIQRSGNGMCKTFVLLEFLFPWLIILWILIYAEFPGREGDDHRFHPLALWLQTFLLRVKDSMYFTNDFIHPLLDASRDSSSLSEL